MAEWPQVLRRRREPPPVPPPPPPPPPPGVPQYPPQRAAELLMSKLTPEQRRTAPLGYFDVTGSLGGRYRIDITSTVQNIAGLGDRAGEYCVGPIERQPKADVWLSQKLLIEADEEYFLRTAVATWQRGRQYMDYSYWW